MNLNQATCRVLIRPGVTVLKSCVLLSALLLSFGAQAQGETVLPRSGSAPPPGAMAIDPRSPLPVPGIPSESEISVLVIPGEETTLSSQMAGKVLRVHPGLGQQVAAGTVLVEFDCSEQKAQMEAAEAEHRGLRETHLTKLRLQALGAAGELEVTVAASAADKARSQVTLRESQLAYCAVRAPFAGRVARMRVKAAESVQLGQPLVEMVNNTSLKTQMFVPAAFMRWLKVGLPFAVRFEETRQTYRATVSKLNARIEGVSQQLEVEGEFEGVTPNLLPGMVGSARFPNRPRN